MDDIGKLIQSLFPLLIFAAWFLLTASARKKKKQRMLEESRPRRPEPVEDQANPPDDSDASEPAAESPKRSLDELFDQLGIPRPTTPESEEEPGGGEYAPEKMDEIEPEPARAPEKRSMDTAPYTPEKYHPEHTLKGDGPAANSTELPRAFETGAYENRQEQESFAGESQILQGEIGGSQDSSSFSKTAPLGTAVKAMGLTELQKAVIWMEILNKPVSMRDREEMFA
jgi:hypothetical protein